MTITYRPKGVCSQLMQVEVEDGIIRKVEVQGVQRQFAGHFQTAGGDARGRRHRAAGGNPLRLQADVLPGSARKSAADVDFRFLRIAKKIYIIASNN